MHPNRSSAGTHSRALRTAAKLLAALTVLVGLLAMHSVSAGTVRPEAGAPSAAAELGSAATPTAAAIIHPDMTTNAPAQLNGAAPHEGHAGDDRGGSGGIPDHSMLLMVCALALLSVMFFVIVRVQLPPLGPGAPLLATLRTAPRALPWPPPPSLLVLSISRT